MWCAKHGDLFGISLSMQSHKQEKFGEFLRRVIWYHQPEPYFILQLCFFSHSDQLVATIPQRFQQKDQPPQWLTHGDWYTSIKLEPWNPPTANNPLWPTQSDSQRSTYSDRPIVTNLQQPTDSDRLTATDPQRPTYINRHTATDPQCDDSG